jgi:radical SAM protein with 4Fe4S-binding SPASM domain
VIRFGVAGRVGFHGLPVKTPGVDDLLFMNDSLNDKDSPVLADGVLLNRANSNGRFLGVVYFPSSGKKVHINEHLSVVLDYCNGTRTVSSILNSLARKFHEPKAELRDPLLQVLSTLEDEHVISIRNGDEPSKRVKVPPVLETQFPLHSASIEVTADCNLKCVHCFGKYGNQHFDELSVDEMKDIAGQLKSLQAYEITLTGGEPLVREDFFDVASAFTSQGFGVILMSNGTLIDDAAADRIADSGIQTVAVSLDGVRSDSHDLFRGVRGAFQKTMKGIELLADRGVRLRFYTVLNRLNLGELKALLELYRKFDASYTVSRSLLQGRARENRSLLLSSKEYMRAYERFLSAEETVFHGVSSRSDEGGREELAQKPLKDRHRCNAAVHHINIRPDGTVTPCASLCHRKFAMGSVRKRLIEDIWLEPEGLAPEIRKLKAADVKKCSSCQLLEYCGSGCMASVFLDRGNVHGPDLASCSRMEAYKNFFRKSGIRRW